MRHVDSFDLQAISAFKSLAPVEWRFVSNQDEGRSIEVRNFFHFVFTKHCDSNENMQELYEFS